MANNKEGNMIKAYQAESMEGLAEDIGNAVDSLNTGDTLWVEIEPTGEGPAGLYHTGGAIRVIVLDPDLRWQRVVFRYEDDAFNGEWRVGTAEDVAMEALKASES
jgi:hypothetical protein